MSKKIWFAFLCLVLCASIKAANIIDFPTAVRTCEKFSANGSASSNGIIFDINISLTQAKNNTCVYKEKIIKDGDYSLLTCNFQKSYLPFIADSMSEYNNAYRKQIAKNPIFGAKLTSNGQIFNKYLVNPKICTITTSAK